MSRNFHFKKCIATFVTTIFLFAGVYAQQLKVSGVVADSKSQETLPGVNVTVKGTSKGVTTDATGKFSISVAKGSILTFSYLGYTSQDVLASANMMVALDPSATQLNEVVVTALGIKRERKALGFAMQEVKSDELVKTSESNVVSAIQGKVAGVDISQSGSGTGGSAKITIRGNRSLSGSNEPLWIVDGVPFNDNQSTAGGEWGGVDRAGAAYDINPQNIESISVLKGPNAAALYGARAANGAIVITTKKGTKGQNGLGVDYNGGVTFSKAAYFLDQQTKYGQGSGGNYDNTSGLSWGSEMKGQSLVAWNGKTIPYTAQTNRINDFFRTGVAQTHNVAFSGGNDKGSFRASIGDDNDEGIFTTQKVQKGNYDLKADYQINKFLTIDTKISYSSTNGINRPQMGNYSVMSYLNSMPMNIRTEDLQPGYTIDPATGNHIEQNFKGPNANYRNPYFLQAQSTNEDWRYRTFGYIAGTIKFSDHLSLRLKHGIDFYRERIEEYTKYNDNVYSSNSPSMAITENFFKEQNSEFLLTYTQKLSDFSTSFSVGGNKMNTYTESLYGSSGQLGMEGAYFLNLGTNKNTYNGYSEKEIQSLYAFSQIGYKDYLYLDITARNDWSSTLPANNRSYFYPSVSLSGIVSEMTKLPEWVSFFKLRGSWAMVGKDTDPYQLYSTFDTSSGQFKYIQAGKPTILKNSNLKPENTNSWELGSDIRFFQNRLGLDITYYNTNTINQVLPVDVDQSTGYSQKYINAGKISNKGLELMINTVPIKTKDLTVNLDFNFASNKTKIVSLDPEVKEYTFGEISSGPKVVGDEGGELGDILDRKYERNAAGKIIVDADGLPKLTELKSVIGNLQPDWTGSVKLGADYKGLFFSTLFSIRQGGTIVSLSEQYAAAAGTALRTQDRSPLVVPNSVNIDGTPNTKQVSAQDYWQRVSGTGEEFAYNASFVKLKELAIGYSLPAKLLQKVPYQCFRSVRISFVGRNLFYLSKHTPGTVPDGSNLNRTIFAQAFDFAPVPNVRTYGFSLNVGF